jgi:hypothetical protein
MDTYDLLDSAGALLVGLVTLTIQIVPFALPLLVLVIGPLAVLGVAALVVASPVLVPLVLIAAWKRMGGRSVTAGTTSAARSSRSSTPLPRRTAA